LQDLGARFGASFDAVKTHASADLLGVSRPKTAQEMKVLQTHVESLYEKFVTLVAKGRKLPLADVKKHAEGRVWMGMDARRIGLVQELGGLAHAIARAAELASLGEDYEVIEMPEVSTPMDDFVEMLDSQAQARPIMPNSSFSALAENAGWSEAKQFLRVIEDSRRTYSWLSWYRGAFGFHP